jgi:hypothetical protein
MRRQLAPLAALLALGAALPAMAETVAITGARILTAGPAGTLEQGVVVIRDGRIQRHAAQLGHRVVAVLEEDLLVELLRTGQSDGGIDRLVAADVEIPDELVEEQPPHRIGCLTHARNRQGEHDCRYKRPQTGGSPGGMSHLHTFSLLLLIVHTFSLLLFVVS